MTTNTEISTAAAALGRKGGSAKSEAKTTTARANGAKGGRPNLFKQAQERLADTNVEVKRFRGSLCNYATANYLVRIQTGAQQTMRDGSFWDGWEHVGHFDTIQDAVAAAYEAAGLE